MGFLNPGVKQETCSDFHWPQ